VSTSAGTFLLSLTSGRRDRRRAHQDLDLLLVPPRSLRQRLHSGAEILGGLQVLVDPCAGAARDEDLHVPSAA